MYGKLFESTFTGSMYGSGPVIFATWGYAIAHTKPDSMVEINPRLVAAVLGCKPEEVTAALEFLCAADIGSRSKEADGRRLIREGEYLYRTVNWHHYNNVRNDSDRREYNRIKQQESRERKRQAASTADAADCQHCQPNHAESESESESVPEENQDKKGNGATAPDVPRETFDPESIPGLNLAAWTDWLAYRKGVGKTIKPVSLTRAAKALAVYGADQQAVVDQSIAAGWQGLFALKPMNGIQRPGRRAKTTAQLEAEEAERAKH